VEVIKANDQFEWNDQVLTLGSPDQVFVIVSRDDEIARFNEVVRLIKSRRTEMPDNFTFGVFQSTLLCGVGSCDACTLRTRDGMKMICVDGPTFDLMSVKLGATD
jgi:hypothetical protein